MPVAPVWSTDSIVYSGKRQDGMRWPVYCQTTERDSTGGMFHGKIRFPTTALVLGAMRGPVPYEEMQKQVANGTLTRDEVDLVATMRSELVAAQCYADSDMAIGGGGVRDLTVVGIVRHMRAGLLSDDPDAAHETSFLTIESVRFDLTPPSCRVIATSISENAVAAEKHCEIAKRNCVSAGLVLVWSGNGIVARKACETPGALLRAVQTHIERVRKQTAADSADMIAELSKNIAVISNDDFAKLFRGALAR
jgi:hypothetical protein